MNTFHTKDARDCPRDGKDGRDGRDGRDGLNGHDGRDGRDGFHGNDGHRGLHGEKGDTGPRGSNGRDGRDGLDGINGIDGDDGICGEKGQQGAQGPQGPQGPVCQSKHLNTSTFSFTGMNGDPGILYKPGSEVLNILNRANMPITYIGIIWSSNGANLSFFIDIKDHNNTLITRLAIGPSTNPINKNVYEIHLNPPINTPITRLLRFIVSKDISLYSIMIGH
jgi:hypothetical protein